MLGIGKRAEGKSDSAQEIRGGYLRKDISSTVTDADHTCGHFAECSGVAL